MFAFFRNGGVGRRKIFFGIFLAGAAILSIHEASMMLQNVCEGVKLPWSKDETRKWIQTNHGLLNRSKIFCETSYIGCYAELEKPIQTQRVMFQFMTPNWCISFCQSNNHKFAAVKGTSCLCSKQFHHVANIRSSSKQCNIICGGSAANDKDRKTCGGEKSVEVYFIKGKCVQAPFSRLYASSRHMGCFETPGDGIPGKYVTVQSPEDCLTVCDTLGSPLATYDQKKQCWCGKAGKNFDLTQNVVSCNASGAVDVFRTSAEDARCGNISFLSPGKYERTELASYPGSGNTWTRYLLEKATGYYTGSVYNDVALSGIGYLGESFKVEETRTDMIKDHYLNDNKVPEFPSAFIVIIRNPYKAIISLINLLNAKTDIHVNFAADKVLKEKIVQLWPKQIENWIKFHRKVLFQNKPMLILYYEDMVADPISGVRKMVEFLPNPALHPSDLEERLACLSQETRGLARRPPRKYSSDFFPSEIRKSVDKAVEEVKEMLRKKGITKKMPPYEKGPDLDW